MVNERKTKAALLGELQEQRERIKTLEEKPDVREGVLGEHFDPQKALEVLLEDTHFLAAYMDAQFNFIWVNKAYALADEKETSFFPGRNHFESYPNEENEKIFREVVETGKSCHFYAKPFQYAYNPERGVTYWNWSLIPIRGHEEIVIGLLLTLQNVTERMRKEILLEKSLEKYQALYSRMTEGMALHEIEYDETGKPVDYTILDVNPAYEKIVGLSRDSVIGTKASIIYGSGDAPYIDIYSQVAESGVPQYFETYFPPLNQHFAISVFSPEQGKFATLFSDISERKRNESKIRRMSRAYRTLSQVNQKLIRVTDTFDLLHEVCRIIIESGEYRFAWVGFWQGLELETMIPAVYEGYEEGYLSTCMAKGFPGCPIMEAARAGNNITCEDVRTDPLFEPCREEMLKRDFRSLIALPLIEGKENIGALSIFSAETGEFDREEIQLLEELAGDVAFGIKSLKIRAEREKMEKELETSRRTLSTLISNLPGMVYRCRNDREWTMDFVSEGCFNITGYRPKDFVSKIKVSFGDLIHPEDRQFVWNSVQKALEEKKPYEMEYRIMTSRGEEKWVWERGRGVFGKRDNLLRLEGFVSDFTSIKKAQEERRETEEKYRILVEQLNDGVFLVVNEKLVWVNKVLEEWFGIEQSDLGGSQGDYIDKFVHPSSQAQLRDGFLKDIESGAAKGEHTFTAIDKEGRERKLEMRLSYTTLRGQPALYGMVRDITEKTQLEEQFRQAQKMEAVGRLAGSVAHDFNNMLTVISGYTEMTLTGLEAGDPIRENLEQVKKGAASAADLTRKLLTFSRKQTMTPAIVDLNSIIGDMKKMLRSLIEENIELKFKLKPDLPKVLVDPVHMEQVIVNLAVNARDAMLKGGRLTMETGAVELDEESIRSMIDFELTPGRYVLLQVSDTGTGMPPEVKSKIFDPFFTTKSAGKGTGLGLSTVYGIVKQLGGNIDVYSEEGHGTIFKIYIPVSSAPSVEEMEAAAQGDVRGGDEIILVVEDETEVREFTVRILTRLGYTVHQAGNSREALELCSAEKLQPDLLISDVVMPGLNGMELARLLKKKCPGLKVIFITGYTEETISDIGIIDLKDNLLQKPFSSRDLALKVREALEG